MTCLFKKKTLKKVTNLSQWWLRMGINVRHYMQYHDFRVTEEFGNQLGKPVYSLC